VVATSAGEVVLVPFSDLTQSKLRPAVCLADVGRGDWVLCRVTSNPTAASRTAGSTYSPGFAAAISATPTLERWLGECRRANVSPGQVTTDTPIPIPGMSDSATRN
jgi:hypothetical protein